MLYQNLKWWKLPAGDALDRIVMDAYGYTLPGDPPFSVSVDYALTLLPGPPNTIMLSRIDTDRWHCSLNSILSNLKYMGEGAGETPALAICRCFLNWKDNERHAQVP